MSCAVHPYRRSEGRCTASCRRGMLVSFGLRNPLQAVLSKDDAAQDFLRVADILEPGLNAGRNVMGDRMRGELPQGLKFQII